MATDCVKDIDGLKTLKIQELLIDFSDFNGTGPTYGVTFDVTGIDAVQGKPTIFVDTGSGSATP